MPFGGTAFSTGFSSEFKQAVTWLLARVPTRERYGIERMQYLMSRMGVERWNFKAVHVTGTNGKGSVCMLLDGLFRKQGLRTGLALSPHLVDVRERMQVAGNLIGEAEFVGLVNELRPTIEAIDREAPSYAPSFFELTMFMAFTLFERHKVDLAFVETGLGGRYDSSNVLDPVLAIITSISLDHTEILGRDLASIAEAKAGIIKPNRPCLVGPLTQVAQSVIRSQAESLNAPLTELPEIKLTPRALNESIALAGASILDPALDKASAEACLRSIHLPGRSQRLKLANGAALLLDPAHNEASISSLVQTLKAEPPVHCLVAASSLERAELLQEKLAPLVKSLTFVDVPGATRLVPPPALREHFGPSLEIIPLDQALATLHPSRTYLVAGSFYLVGAVLGVLESQQ